MSMMVLKVVFLVILAGAIYIAMSTGLSREEPDPECEVPVIVEVLNGCGEFAVEALDPVGAISLSRPPGRAEDSHIISVI